MRDGLRFVWIGLGIALAYLAWIAVARFISTGDEPKKPRREIVAYPGTEGTGLKILQFYANSGEVTKGEQATICYGVVNARAVRIEPEIAQLEPAFNRCISAAPQRTTTFRLVAEGKEGGSASAEFTIKVNPAPPRILFIDISSVELRRGDLFTMCYGVTNASEIRFSPMNWKLPPSDKACRSWFPPRTFKYTLTAVSPEGRIDTETFTVKVK